MNNTPIFPASLQALPFFSDLIKACEGQTECAPQFIFSAGLVAASAIIGRRIGSDNFPEPIHPVMYIVLCGESGGSKKSAAIKLCEQLMQAQETQAVQMIHGLATGEGLVRSFALPRNREHGGGWVFPDRVSGIEDDDEREKAEQTFMNSGSNEPIGVDRYVDQQTVEAMLKESSDYEGFRGIAIIDELVGVLKKAKSSTSESLISKLCQFYNSPWKISNPTSGSPTTAINPCLSLIGAIPRAWIDRNLKLDDIEAGLGRRVQYICDSKTEPVYKPGPPHSQHFNSAIIQLGKLRERFHQQTIFELDQNADQFLENWYTDFKQDLLHLEKDVMQSIIEGRDQHIRRSALIFSALDHNAPFGIITSNHIGFAKDWSDYVYACQRHIFQDYATTDIEVNEKRIIKWLRGKDYKSARDIYRNTGLSATEAKVALESLNAMGVIERKEEINDTGPTTKTNTLFKLI